MLSGKTFHGIIYGIEILFVCMENFIDQDKIIPRNNAQKVNPSFTGFIWSKIVARHLVFVILMPFFSCPTVFNERR